MITRISILACRHALPVRCLASTTNMPIRNMYTSGSDSITYSGGQAAHGQGGYYGSGGARVINPTSTEHRPGMMALVSDVETISLLMDKVHDLEHVLLETSEESGGEITGKLIEIKSKIKKLCTSPEVIDCLNRLELKGEPIWGLSTEERDMIIAARQKVNEC